jgi:hypothetical protein
MARKRPGETLTEKQRTFCNEYTFTLRDKIMALRIIAQHLGLFIPNLNKEKEEFKVIRPRWLNLPYKEDENDDVTI